MLLHPRLLVAGLLALTLLSTTAVAGAGHAPVSRQAGHAHTAAQPSVTAIGSARARRALALPSDWRRASYGGARGAAPSYSLAYPPGWGAHLWPDTLAAYGQLDLYAPSGATIDVAILPLRPRGPTPAALMAHDAASLLSARQDRVTLPMGPALRLSGVPLPASAGMSGQILYLRRGALLYRIYSSQPAWMAGRATLLQVAATLRIPSSIPGPSHVPPPPPSPETCCHCPAWGGSWGIVLTRLDGVPVYSNAGNVDNGCVGTYGILYQCVELVQRYFALRWGYPDIWRGVGAASDMRWNRPDDVQFIANGGSPGPREGDALVFYGGAVGHVALVQSVDRQTGLLTVAEENWSPTGTASLSIYPDNTIGIRNSAYGSYFIAGWLHSPRNVAPAP